MDDRDDYLGNERYGVVLSFLRGERPDWDGRWLANIRDWDDERLEQDHRYIQWIFPLSIPSEVVFAPVLRPYELDELRRPGPVHEVFVASLRQMLDFYGFELRFEEGRPAVVPSGRHETRTRVWMTPYNHNYRRISRILGSLVLVGLKEYAQAFLEALEHLYRTPEGSAVIDGVSVWYWRRRASGG